MLTREATLLSLLDRFAYAKEVCSLLQRLSQEGLCGFRSLHCRLQEVGGTGSITAVQVKGPESDWEGLANKWGAAWEIVHAPVYPLDIHLTNDQGQEVQTPITAWMHVQHKHPL